MNIRWIRESVDANDRIGAWASGNISKKPGLNYAITIYVSSFQGTTEKMNLTEELVQALNEEIETLKNPGGRSRGGNIVKVFNGRFLREISGLKVYVFNLENFLTALDDSPAEIEVNGYRYSAQVLLTQGLEVEIGIERFSGNFIAEATLHTNSWYLLELLKKKLEEAHSAAKRADFTLSEALFLGTLSGPSPSTQSAISYSLGEPPPNDAQKRAIETSYSSKLSVVWPPLEQVRLRLLRELWKLT